MHFSLVSSAIRSFAARLYSDKSVCTQNSSDLCRWKSKLWTNISSWILEIHWVLLGIFPGYTCPPCGRRELDLKSSGLYLSHQDTDLGSSFQKQLKASTGTLVQEKERPSLPCFDAELMFKCTFLHPLKCSAHWSFSGQSWWYNKLTRSERLACWFFHLSAGDQPGKNCYINCLLKPFMLFGWKTFQDARRNQCFQDLALDVIRLLTLPVLNHYVERPFSQVTWLKDDIRNYTGLRSPPIVRQLLLFKKRFFFVDLCVGIKLLIQSDHCGSDYRSQAQQKPRFHSSCLVFVPAATDSEYFTLFITWLRPTTEINNALLIKIQCLLINRLLH